MSRRHRRRIETPSPPAAPPPALTWRATGVAAGVLFGLLALVFGDVLFAGGSRVLSAPDTDLATQFLDWRAFGFDQLRHGHLPLWNPHTYGGAPYFGGFQSALLYPINWLFLVLPEPMAVNWTIAVNLLLGGVLMYVWLAWRRLAMPAALLGAVVFMFCAPQFLQIYAGHLPHLCVIAWLPLLFLSIDASFNRPSARWLLAGAGALTMEILAGHPQYVFYTAIAVGLHLAARAFGDWRRAARTAAAVAGMAIAAIAITAVQWMPGLQAAAESVRAGGVPYSFASMFGFPPENLLTTISPWFFGTITGVPYWGRAYLWEMCVFFTVTGLVLAVRGAAALGGRDRWISVGTIAALMILAAAPHTPLFPLLYAEVPGFDRFRGTSKFTAFAVLLAVPLAARGAHRWSVEAGPGRTSVRSLAIIAAALAVAGALLFTDAGLQGFSDAMGRVVGLSGESYLDPAQAQDPAFVTQAAHLAGLSLLGGAATLALLAGVLGWSRQARRPRLQTAWALLALAAAESLLFAWTYRPTFDRRELLSSEAVAFMSDAARDSDGRVLNLVEPSLALSIGAYDVWGNDPYVTRRYAEFMAASQHQPPADATQYLHLREVSPLWRLARVHGLIVPDGSSARVVSTPDPLPRFLLVDRWQVAASPDAALAALSADAFDPRATVVLERDPGLPPPTAATNTGTVHVDADSSDATVLRITTSVPAVLLVTDAWTPSWRAVSLPGSSQSSYSLITGDYAFRAIPLRPGVHVLRMEYADDALRRGALVSVGSLVTTAGAAVFVRRRRAAVAP